MVSRLPNPLNETFMAEFLETNDIWLRIKAPDGGNATGSRWMLGG
jgi:hypothetical protein